jgi:hypothetical protein
VHDRQIGMPADLGRRAGQHAVGGEQVIDLAGHLDPAPRHQDEVVGHPLKLGQHVRGQHDRHPVLGRRGHHRGHEVVPGQRVEVRQRFVQHEQARPPSQRQGQRELRLLAAGQLAGLPIQRDAEVGQPGTGVSVVETPVQVAGQVQHVSDRQALIQRRVLRDERDAVQRARRPRGTVTEHGDDARGRRGQADRQVQQRGLARAVRADQRGHVPGGNRQRALAQRPGVAVALAQAAGLDDVHATPSVAWPVLPRRSRLC